jgi:hypothetical protein
MAATHIPLEELSADTRALLERAQEAGEVFVDGYGLHVKISRMPGRTAAESLDIIQNSPNADVEVDDEWSNDMREIIALRHTENYRDPRE